MKTKRRNIKITIEYDGTHFSGWQIQPNARTVQFEIEKALKEITGESIRINGAGRTDAGVHALGQTASFFTYSKISAEKFKDALNSLLPKDIAILKSELVAKDFHARKSAKGKHYRYVIFNRPVFSPINRNYAFCVAEKIDVLRMKKHAQYFVGLKDFSSFGSNAKRKDDPLREIYSLKIRKEGYFIKIDVIGRSFLYKMVRGIAGTLLEIGRGKEINLEEIFSKKNRIYAGPNLPPQGLYLVKVIYK